MASAVDYHKWIANLKYFLCYMLISFSLPNIIAWRYILHKYVEIKFPALKIKTNQKAVKKIKRLEKKFWKMRNPIMTSCFLVFGVFEVKKFVPMAHGVQLSETKNAGDRLKLMLWGIAQINRVADVSRNLVIDLYRSNT